MDWANERYVRVFTRDTEDWLHLSWDARSVWLAMLRKFDRSGVLETKRGPRGVAVVIGAPSEVVERAIPELLNDGCLSEHPLGYLAKSYIAANETPMSDAQRAKEYRERRSVMKRDDGVTFRDETVTPRHAASRRVTPSDPIRPSDPSDPSVKEPPVVPQGGTLVLFPDELREALGAQSREPKSSKAQSRELEARKVTGDVVVYFNRETGKVAQSTVGRVRAVKRILAEGRRFDDIRAVIWSKVHGPKKWLGDEKMDEHLNLDTLLRPSNFPRYLEQAIEEFREVNPKRAAELWPLVSNG